MHHISGLTDQTRQSHYTLRRVIEYSFDCNKSIILLQQLVSWSINTTAVRTLNVHLTRSHWSPPVYAIRQLASRRRILLHAPVSCSKKRELPRRPHRLCTHNTKDPPIHRTDSTCVVYYMLWAWHGSVGSSRLSSEVFRRNDDGIKLNGTVNGDLPMDCLLCLASHLSVRWPPNRFIFECLQAVYGLRFRTRRSFGSWTVRSSRQFNLPS